MKTLDHVVAFLVVALVCYAMVALKNEPVRSRWAAFAAYLGIMILGWRALWEAREW